MTDHPMTNESEKEVQSASPANQPLITPDLIRTLGTLLGSSSPQNAVKTQEADVNTESNSATPQASAPLGGDGLSALLSNPEMLEKLPQLISVLKPMMGTISPPQTLQPKLSSPDAERDQLLLSLKPFLSKKRCEAIDNMLRIGKLGSVLQGLK